MSSADARCPVPGASPSEISRLVPWFGANAKHAAAPAALLAGCKWVYIPFAGSMVEVPHFAPGVQLMVSDLHDEVIALAKIVRQPEFKADIAMRLGGNLFHPAVLEDAKQTLRVARMERGGSLFGLTGRVPTVGLVDQAEAYFIVAWMGRSAVAGTRGEESVGLALRYDAGGGDPVTRYRSAVAGLDWWHEQLRRCSFTRESVFEVLARLAHRGEAENREKAIGVYMDPPWPDDGDGYLHRMSAADQRRLAREAAALPGCRVVMRFGDHPLIRELYPESVWDWKHAESADQHGGKVAEVYLIRRDGGSNGQIAHGQMVKWSNEGEKKGGG